MKMDKKITKFDANLKLKNTDFTNINAQCRYIMWILVPNKVSFSKKGFKYFIDYKDSIKVRPNA